MGMISEFKEFAMKGNIIGHFSGGLDFSAKKIVLSPAELDATGAVVEGTGAAISYGSFVNAIIAFAILAWVLFMIIKGMNAAKKAEEEAPEAPPANEVLLAEIRDLLAKK